MFLSLLSKKEDISLIIDIGNGNISGALVLFNGNLKPKLIYSTNLQFTIGFESNIKETHQNINIVLGEILNLIIIDGLKQEYFNNKDKIISSVIISLSSPWFKSNIKNIHLSKDIPFVISSKFIKSILETEEKIFEKEVINEKDDDLIFDDGNNKIQVIESVVVNSKLNGYSINKVLDKKTKLFDLSIYQSFGMKSLLDSIKNQIFRFIHIPKNALHFYTFPIVSFSVIKDIFPSINNFLIFDISSEATDVTLVIDGILTNTLAFPSGRNFIIRKISKSFDVPVEIAESFLHIYSSNKIDSNTSLRIESLIQDIEKEWSIYFEDIFSELSRITVLPNYAFLIAEDDIIDLYDSFLKVPKTDITSLFRKNIIIKKINDEILSDKYINNNKFKPNKFISILSIFFNKIKKNKL